MERTSNIRVKGHPICPYCKDAVRPDQEKEACHGCMAWHHSECWGQHEGCAVCRPGSKTEAGPGREPPRTLHTGPPARVEVPREAKRKPRVPPPIVGPSAQDAARARHAQIDVTVCSIPGCEEARSADSRTGRCQAHEADQGLESAVTLFLALGAFALFLFGLLGVLSS